MREEWCLGCHLCEYNCAFSNSGQDDMVKALKDKDIRPRIHVEDGENDVHFAVSCRHCDDALCLKSCIAGAISKRDGVVCIDRTSAWALHLRAGVPLWGPAPQRRRPMEKCQLCLDSAAGEPACVRGCPNRPSSLKKRRGRKWAM